MQQYHKSRCVIYMFIIAVKNLKIKSIYGNLRQKKMKARFYNAKQNNTCLKMIKIFSYLYLIMPVENVQKDVLSLEFS